jgi:hypothetical protein
MQQKVEAFIATSQEIKENYKKASDPNLQQQILQQYQKSLHRLVNDALEINAFDLAQKAMDSASFCEEMKSYVVNDLLLGRLKLIQHSGSYRLVKRLKGK